MLYLILLAVAIVLAGVYELGHQKGQSLQASLIAGYIKVKAAAVPEFATIVTTVKADTNAAVAKLKSLL